MKEVRESPERTGGASSDAFKLAKARDKKTGSHYSQHCAHCAIHVFFLLHHRTSPMRVRFRAVLIQVIFVLGGANK